MKVCLCVCVCVCVCVYDIDSRILLLSLLVGKHSIIRIIKREQFGYIQGCVIITPASRRAKARMDLQKIASKDLPG